MDDERSNVRSNKANMSTYIGSLLKILLSSELRSELSELILRLLSPGIFVVFFIGTFIHPFNRLGVFIFWTFIFVFLYRRLICDRNATGFSLKRQKNFFIRYFPFKKVTLLREEILAGRYVVEFYFTILGLNCKIQFCETKKHWITKIIPQNVDF